jgi:protein gp37
VATKIQWTEETWNPISGCFKVSPGCRSCYAIRQAIRMKGNPNPKISSRYFNVVDARLTNWSGEVGFDEEVLLQPLKKRKPTMYFISLSDLFYDKRPDADIDHVFAVMALTPQHTYQILTKYPERMLAWCERLRAIAGKHRPSTVCKTFNESDVLNFNWMHWRMGHGPAFPHSPWPLPNVWLGVSVENQQYADERIPLLLRTPAAKRFVSYEPALGPVDFSSGFYLEACCDNCDYVGSKFGKFGGVCCLNPSMRPPLDWVIVGGESGPGARPFDIAWARQTVEQCKAAGVACFVKQLGSHPYDSTVIDIMGPDNVVHYRRPPGDPMLEDVKSAKGYWTRESVLTLADKKGGEPMQWPEDLRVRQMPGEVRQ